MPPLETAQLVFLGCVGLFTLLTAFTDLWMWKIPNKVTFPMFLLGFAYQGVFHGGAGLLDGLLGFLIGFGAFFVFWMIGISGGGDVKLVGALSVWLGMKLVLPVLAVTTGFVAVIHVFYIAWQLVTKGSTATRKKMLETKAPRKIGQKEPAPQEDLLAKRVGGRVIMGYAVPVAMATWSVMVWKLL